MMKTLIFTSSLLLTLNIHAESSSIDSTQTHCLDNASTTLAMQQCYAAANQAWDKEMNQQYSQLSTKLNKDQKAKLRTAQRAWLKYRDSWLEASQSRMADGGTLARVQVAAQSVVLVKNQALALKSLATGSCADPDDC